MFLLGAGENLVPNFFSVVKNYLTTEFFFNFFSFSYNKNKIYTLYRYS